MLANGLHRIRWRRVAVARIHRTAAHSLEILAFILLFGSRHFSRDRLALEQFSFLDYGIADHDGSSL